jgi:hypothetical protein
MQQVAGYRPLRPVASRSEVVLRPGGDDGNRGRGGEVGPKASPRAAQEMAARMEESLRVATGHGR